MLPRRCPACKERSLATNEDELFCTSCPIYRQPLRWYQRPLAWAERRYWWWRLPIMAWFALVLYQNIRDPLFSLQRLSNPLSALDLGIHELGHFLFMPFGTMLHIAGGSIFQIAFPLLWMIGFWQKKWYFAMTMCWCWLGLNLFDVATYAADARARLLPLVTGPAGMFSENSDELYDQGHDWYQLLSRMGHLDQDLAIAQGFRIAAVAAFVIGFMLGGLLLLQMIRGSLERRAIARRAE